MRQNPICLPPEAGIDKNLAHRARSLAAVAGPGIEPLEAGGRGELIAPAAKGLAAENAVLRRRVAALAEENSELKDLVKMWKARARQAGWIEPADASPGGG